MYLQDINFKISCFLINDTLARWEQEEQEHQQLIFVMWGVVIPIISVVGFFGNCLTMIVLFRREIMSTTIFFLRTLVVTDTIIILGIVLGLSVIAITQRNKDLWLFTDVIYPHIYSPMYYIVMTLLMINVWIIVAVSMVRYITTCHPSRSVGICTRKNAFIYFAVIVIISVLYNIPRCFATTTVRCSKDAKYDQCFHLITTDFGKTLFYTKIYVFWMDMILMYTIPLVVLLVLSTLLIRQLIRMHRRRTPSNVQENSESSMSLVLVLMVIKFILCYTPVLCAQFIFLETHLSIASNSLVIFNSSVNFIIYTAAWRKFRKALLEMFPVLVKKPWNKFTKANKYFNDNGTEQMELRRLTTEPSELSSSGAMYNQTI